MSTQKRVYERLSKIDKLNLEANKVELSLVDDLDSLNNSYYTDTDSANGLIKGLLSDARKVESKIEQAIKSADKMPKLISEVKKSIKGLGINESSVKQLGESERAFNESKEYKKVLSKVKNFISSI